MNLSGLSKPVLPYGDLHFEIHHLKYLSNLQCNEPFCQINSKNLVRFSYSRGHVPKLFIKIIQSVWFYGFTNGISLKTPYFAGISGLIPFILKILRTLPLEKTLNKVHILSLASIMEIEMYLFRLYPTVFLT